MAARPEVRDAQRRIAALDAAHARASAGLEQVIARRSALLDEQDRHVAQAQATVDQAVAAMARQLSVELAAQLLGLPVGIVRRCVKDHPALSESEPAAL